jgi:hypothetical protein
MSEMSFEPNPRVRGNVILKRGAFKISRTKQYELWDRLMKERSKAAQNYIQVAQQSGKFTAPYVVGKGAYGVSRFMRMKRSRRMIGFGRDIRQMPYRRRGRSRSRSVSSSSSSSRSRSRSRSRVMLHRVFASPQVYSVASPRPRRSLRVIRGTLRGGRK